MSQRSQTWVASVQALCLGAGPASPSTPACRIRALPLAGLAETSCAFGGQCQGTRLHHLPCCRTGGCSWGSLTLRGRQGEERQGARPWVALGMWTESVACQEERAHGHGLLVRLGAVLPGSEHPWQSPLCLMLLVAVRSGSCLGGGIAVGAAECWMRAQRRRRAGALVVPTRLSHVTFLLPAGHGARAGGTLAGGTAPSTLTP